MSNKESPAHNQKITEAEDAKDKMIYEYVIAIAIARKVVKWTLQYGITFSDK